MLPKLITLDITSSDFEITVRKMGGLGGPSGTDSMMLKDWYTRFGSESESLREELSGWTHWLSNRSPQWALYRTLMARYLLDLDKIPGVLPVRIGEAIRRLMAKLVHAITSHQSLEPCGRNNLCSGLKVSIKGSVHASKLPFEKGPPLTQSRPKATPRERLDLIQCRRGDSIPVNCRKSNRNTQIDEGR